MERPLVTERAKQPAVAATLHDDAADFCAGAGLRPLLGLNFAELTIAAAARLVAGRPPNASFQYVVTPNADHLVRLSRNPWMMPLYEMAWLRLMDSRVVARVAHLLGLRAPPVVPGSDLTQFLLMNHLHSGERVTIIGLAPAHLPELMTRCGLAQPAHYDPPLDFDTRPQQLAQAVQFVIDNPARLIFVAVGSPRQERLCAAIAGTGRATGTALCIGASLEYLAGAKPRAPHWMQNAGLEWLHRLATNPRRLARRYLLDSPPVFKLLMQERWAARSRG